jgi:hypothetical protein
MTRSLKGAAFLPLLLTVASGAEIGAPRIWDDQALADWSSPVAALGVRPGHFTAAEYYGTPSENLRTYPVYRPDREPAGYWEWLQKQRPQALVNAANLRTREDWQNAGKQAFRELADPFIRTADPEIIRSARDPKSYDGVWTLPDGTLLNTRWVVTEHGIQLAVTACSSCHSLPRPDGTVLWAAPPGPPPNGSKRFVPVRLGRNGDPAATGDSFGMRMWRQYTVPWAPDERIERLREATEEAARALQRPGVLGAFPRTHGSPYYMTKTPDLNNLHYSRYMDATGTHRLRGPEDVARYAAFVTGADPMEFGEYHILRPEQRRLAMHYADEVLYAIGMYLWSLEPPANPDPPPPAKVARGREVFVRETCANCHSGEGYTSGRLTLAEGYRVPKDHPNRADVAEVSVGTDPGLAVKTRKGTGFYKVPSLRGVWYRPLFLHDGSAASLEEMFDPGRLRPDHEPAGWKGPGVSKRAIPGHPFGLGLNADEKDALLAYLRTL